MSRSLYGRFKPWLMRGTWLAGVVVGGLAVCVLFALTAPFRHHLPYYFGYANYSIRTVGHDAPLPSGWPPRVEFPNYAPQRGMTHTGTAFAMPAAGTWATARHVIDGCLEIIVDAGRDQLGVRQVLLPAVGDAAVLVTEGSAGRALNVGAGSQIHLSDEQPVFALGFPQGRTGAVVADSGIDVQVGSGYGVALGAAWTVERGPLLRDRDSFGGLSGAPLLDHDGTVLGIVVAWYPPRALLFTISPAYLAEPGRSDRAEARPPQLTLAITPGFVDSINIKLQQDGTIARVRCRT